MRGLSAQQAAKGAVAPVANAVTGGTASAKQVPHDANRIMPEAVTPAP